MSDKARESLREFEPLMGQLSLKENRPVSQRMSATAKRALRQKLLDAYGTQTLSRQGVWQLWRFAGGVAGVLLVAVVVIGFGLAISQTRTTGSSDVPTVKPTASGMETAVPATTPDLTALPMPPNPDLKPDLPIELGDSIRLIGFSVSDAIYQFTYESGWSLPISLSWETTGKPTADYTAFVHLFDEYGTLIAQADEPLGATSTYAAGTRFDANLDLWKSEDLPPGTYSITTGIYDNRTGQQLPQNNNGQGVQLALYEVFSPDFMIDLPVNLGDSIQLVDVTVPPQPYQPGKPLQVNLAWETTGQPTADYTAFVHLSKNGSLVAQADRSLGSTSTEITGTRIATDLTLLLPDDLPQGIYILTTGLYDGNTGQRLPDNDSGQDLGLMQIEVVTETAVTPPTPITPSTTFQPSATLPVELGNDIFLFDYTISPQPFQPGQVLKLFLYWQTDGQPITNYNVFAHMLDENGRLITQADQPLGEFATFPGNKPVNELIMWLHSDLEPGTYALEIGLYDNETGQRTPQTNENAFYLADVEVLSTTEVIHYATVTGTNNSALTVRERPDGQPITVVEEGGKVRLADAPRVESDSFIWQAVETIDGQSGWVASEFLTYPDNYQLAEIIPAPFPPLENVQIISAKQFSRTSMTDPITFEITLKVTLDSVDEAILKLFYTNPDWQDGEEIPVPVHMIGGDQAVSKDDNVVTVTAVLDPTKMAANVATNTPILMTLLGTPNPEKTWQSSLDLLLLSNFGNVQFDLLSLDSIEYHFDKP